MNIKDLKSRYGLDGPLSQLEDKANQKNIPTDNINFEEIQNKQRLRLQQLQMYGYEPTNILSPMNGDVVESVKKEQLKSFNYPNNPIEPKIFPKTGRNTQTYNSINDYVNEQVQKAITDRKIQKYQDFNIYVEGQNITKNVNPLPIDFSKPVKSKDEHISKEKNSTTLIRIETYCNRFNKIYERHKKFMQDQQKTQKIINDEE